MEELKNVKVWDEGTGILGHDYESGTPKAILADAIIACVKEADLIGVTPREIFARLNKAEVATTRGFLVLSFYQAFKRLEMQHNTRPLAAGLFGKHRTVSNHYEAIADGGKDVIYETISNGPIGKNVKAHLDVFVQSMKSHPAWISAQKKVHRPKTKAPA